MSDRHPTKRQYDFLGSRVALALPDALMEPLDLLYGAFAIEPGHEPCVASIAWAHGQLRLGTRSLAADGHQAVACIQSYFQNTIWASHTGALLWHAAVWRCGGKGILLLGESGAGKTTLSLAEHQAGGEVWSDELGPWSPARQGLLPFPRALSIRPATLALLGVTAVLPRLLLDEEKALLALSTRAAGPGHTGLPIAAVIFLDWPEDPAVAGQADFLECRISAQDETWRSRLMAQVPGLALTPHPDAGGWWRCVLPDGGSVRQFEAAMKDVGAQLTGFHRGARRPPTFDGLPVLEEMDTAAAAARSLADLVNARALAAASSPAEVLAQAGAAFSGARAYRCVPGNWAATHRAIRALAGVTN